MCRTGTGSSSSLPWCNEFVVHNGGEGVHKWWGWRAAQHILTKRCSVARQKEHAKPSANAAWPAPLLVVLQTGMQVAVQ